jgi:hypothetical protein
MEITISNKTLKTLVNNLFFIFFPP